MKKIHKYWFLGGGYDTNYALILQRADSLGYTKPLGNILTPQNKFIATTYDVISLVNIFYAWSNGGAAQNFALLNWAENANTFNADYPTAITYGVNGVMGNGVDQYISTNWNAALNGGSKYLLNSASRGAWIYTAGASPVIDGTITTGGRNSIRNQNSASVQKINQGGNNLASALDFSSTGYVAIDRLDSTNVSGYNDLVKTDTTATSVSLHNEEQVIFRSGSTYGNPTLSMYYAGGHLTEAQHNKLRNNFATYLTEIGL